MRAFSLTLALLAVIVGAHGPAAAAGLPDAAAHAHDGRVGVLPQSWVEALENNSISEQTALVVGGATAAAIGVGAVAGASVGGATGAVALALFLAHWPLQIALMGSGGYVAWNYLWPSEPAPAGSGSPPSATRIGL